LHKQNHIHSFIFDSGATYSSIPERDCSKFGIKVIIDSLDYYDHYIKVGIAPKFKIGEIVANNLLFFIFPDSISKVPKRNISLRVIGWDFMHTADNIQLTNENVIFNQKLNNTKLNNFLIDGSVPLINIQIGDSDVIFLLDKNRLF